MSNVNQEFFQIVGYLTTIVLSLYVLWVLYKRILKFISKVAYQIISDKYFKFNLTNYTYIGQRVLINGEVYIVKDWEGGSENTVFLNSANGKKLVKITVMSKN